MCDFSPLQQSAMFVASLPGVARILVDMRKLKKNREN